jgi:hypothetical protein
MKNRKLILLFVPVFGACIFLLLSCSISDGNKVLNQQPSQMKIAKDDSNKIFTSSKKVDEDSCKNLICYVRRRLTIPHSLIKKETLIDTVYINYGAIFTGDTIYSISRDHSILILDYNDGLVCLNKFILIIDNKSNINTDYILGSTDCDRNGDNEYFSTYFLIKGEEIIISKKFAAKGVEIANSKIIETKRYSINNYGKLKSL